MATLPACLLLILIACHVIGSADGVRLCRNEHAKFEYGKHSRFGPDQWKEISECCGGNRQSPRDLLASGQVKYTCALPSLRWLSNNPVSGRLYNNGHDPVISFKASNTATLVSAPYAGGAKYKLDNIHIHFNDMNGHGSEHSVSGFFYDSEVHMVHYKADYGSVAAAVDKEDGLLVVGIFLSVMQGSPNPHMKSLIDAIASISGVGEEYAKPMMVNVTDLLPVLRDFFTYAGSLTTPPCSESVRWIVMAEPLKIDKKELSILTSLRNEHGELISKTSNDRPIQHPDSIIEAYFQCSGRR